MPVAVTQSQLTLTSSREAERITHPPWWQRRSRLERTLCALTVVCLVLCATMAIAVVLIGYHFYKEDERNNIRRKVESGGPISEFKGRKLDLLKGMFNNKDSASLRSGTVSYNLKKLEILAKKKKKTPVYLEGLLNDYLPWTIDRGDAVSRRICLGPGCIKAAAVILNNLDTEVDPCDDFYQFACGGWIHTHEIPDDKSSLSSFSLLQDDMDLKLKRLIEKPISEKDPDFIITTKNMYTSCMNTSRIDELGMKPLLEMLKNLGTWPVLEGSNWTESSFDWLDTLRRLRKQGYRHDVLIDMSVSPDLRNNTRHMIDVDQSVLGMPDRSYLLKGKNDTAVKAYYRLMVESAVLLGVNRSFAEEEMMDVLEFEISLANISLPREERRNISQLYNKRIIGDLYELAPQIEWMRFFNSLLLTNVTRSEPIIVVVPEYIRKAGNILNDTDKRIIANYMWWRVIFQSLPMLNRPWGEISQHYSSVITGKVQHAPRWEQCLGSVMGSLGLAIASLYVRHHFREDSKATALEMVNYIHKEFLKTLEKIDWMDETTKISARQKAEVIKPYIGYPDEILNDKELSNFYKELNLSANSYFNNVLKLRKWAVDYTFRKLREPNIKGDWKKHAGAAVVNAFYSSLENSIEFPAGILQGIFFSRDRPNSLNFGGIGFVIGHEITHGFDDTGRQFDKDGNNVNWWKPETDEKFRERAQCIIQQYGNFTVPEIGLNVNGINTQGENIADNGGLKLAYWAYQSWKKENGYDVTLPGLQYSSDQLFWISAASVWCGKYRPEDLKLRILSGYHSPPKFRVIGTLSNMPEFFKDFQCSASSKMNSAKKCSVW